MPHDPGDEHHEPEFTTPNLERFKKARAKALGEHHNVTKAHNEVLDPHYWERCGECLRVLDTDGTCSRCSRAKTVVSESLTDPTMWQASEAFAIDMGHGISPFTTLDSGDRTEYPTGAVRDKREGKGRFDLLPYPAMLRVAQLYERGVPKYGDHNWRKGMPISDLLDSAIRHALKASHVHYCKKHGIECPKDIGCEDHSAAAVWNLLAVMEMEETENA